MKTKYILHGGFTPKNQNENNEDLYREILKDAPKYVEVLMVPFAKDPDRVTMTTERVVSEFNKIRQHHSFVFEVAEENSFIEQIKSADIVYFQGGKTLRLLEVVKRFPDLKEALKGKIVVGESAGANILGKYFFSPSANGVFEGLGILPFKIIPHYKEEYKDIFKDLRPDLETVHLKEYEFRVFH